MAEHNPLFDEVRVVLYHKQSTSARTLFLRQADGGVVAPEPLPVLSSVLDDGECPDRDSPLAPHPASLALALCRRLELPADFIEIDPVFRVRIDTPGRLLTAYLGRFTRLDPPRRELEPHGASFRPLTELRGCAPAEMALLRKAYETILGG
jgi:hypothetical protein